MSNSAHMLRVIAGGLDRPDFFIRTQHLSIEIDDVLIDLRGLSALARNARAYRDKDMLASINQEMSRRVHQLRAMTECIEAHIKKG